MDITVTFIHTEPTESLRTYAEEKISKIDKYLDSPCEAHIVLTVEKFRHQADVTLGINGTRIKGVEETGDMYSAIDQVMDKIEKQVKKFEQTQSIPVLLCSPTIRIHLKKLLERFMPQLVLLSHSEIDPRTNVNSLGMVSI